MTQRRPLYRDYERNVFDATAGSEHWLEEALAQAVVLESTLIANRLKLRRRESNGLVTAQFDTFGDGYRHFRCPSYGGPERAHKVLGAQVVTGSPTPKFSLTEFATPKREYTAKAESVPGYLAWRPRFVSRFQQAMPKARKWAKFARVYGFTFHKPGPGDHQTWILGKQKVQVNFINGECDRLTIKAVAEILGKTFHQVVQEMRTA